MTSVLSDGNDYSRERSNSKDRTQVLFKSAARPKEQPRNKNEPTSKVDYVPNVGSRLKVFP